MIDLQDRINKTIYNQINGDRAMWVIGGTAISTDKGLQVSFGIRAKNKAKSFLISYDEGLDLYNITFYNKKGEKIESISEVYADQLIPIIEKKTGLFLSL